MNLRHRTTRTIGFYVMIIFLGVSWLAATGCQEVDTLKRELLKKAQGKILKQKSPFTPRDGMTIRGCSLYQTANPNSEVTVKLPAETPVHLVDKVGEYYRTRTRRRKGRLS